MPTFKSLFISRGLVSIFFFIFMLSNLTAATSVIKYTPATITTKPQGEFYDSSNNLLQISSMTSGSLTLFGTVASIGVYAFHNISSVTSVTLPESVYGVGYFAFSNCKSLTKPIYNSKVFARLPISQSGDYTIPNGITTIASAAFRECSKITSVTISSSVTEIEESAFSLCTTLAEITLGEAVTKIGDHAFWQCSKLTKIHAGAKPATVSSHTFNGITPSAVTVYVPSASVATYKNTAIWKNFNIVAETQIENSYTIHFSEGGYNDVQLKYSERYTLPTPTKNGYSFDGWKYNNMTYEGGTSIFGLTSVNGATITLTALWSAVETPVNSDFRVWFAPFQIGQYTPCYMRCETNVKEISFDIIMPTWVLANNSSYSVTSVSNDYLITNEKASSSMLHVIVKNSDGQSFGKGEKIHFANFYMKDTGLPEDVYFSTFTNQSFLASNNVTYKVEEYNGNYFVGTPTASSFSGDFSDSKSFSLLQQTITRSLKANYGNIFLTDVNALPANTEIDTSENPNVIIFSSSNLSLTNSKNVVIDGICENLIVEDSFPFSNKSEFTARNAIYERNTSSNWGTLFLPFQIYSNPEVSLYQISDSDISSGMITLSAQNMIPANTPCFFKCVGACAFHSSNVKIPISTTDDVYNLNSTTVYGTFKKNVLSSSAFYMANNTLWRNTGKLTINPYRSWLECSNAPQAISLRTDESTNISEINNNDKQDITIFDLNGHIVKHPELGYYYFINGKKVLLK